MSTKIKLLLVVSLLTVLTLVISGCGSSHQTGESHNTTSAPMATTMPKEDPLVFIKDMNQSLAAISEQTKLNKLEDAKKTAVELLALNDKLAMHITDAKRKEAIQQSVLALQAEIQKSSPSQSAIDKQLQVVKTLLTETNTQMKNHQHQ